MSGTDDVAATGRPHSLLLMLALTLLLYPRIHSLLY